MTRKEAIKTIEMAISQIEWDYPIDYVAAFDKAIEILKQPEIVRCKDCVNCIEEPNGDLYCDILAVGYEPLGSKRVTEDWFCADGERRVSK